MKVVCDVANCGVFVLAGSCTGKQHVCNAVQPHRTPAGSNAGDDLLSTPRGVCSSRWSQSKDAALRAPGDEAARWTGDTCSATSTADCSAATAFNWEEGSNSAVLDACQRGGLTGYMREQNRRKEHPQFHQLTRGL
jgi:hypothetical protein